MALAPGLEMYRRTKEFYFVVINEILSGLNDNNSD